MWEVLLQYEMNGMKKLILQIGAAYSNKNFFDEKYYTKYRLGAVYSKTRNDI